MESLPDLDIRVVDSASADFSALITAFQADLEQRYPGITEEELSSPLELHCAVVVYLGGTPVGCGALRELEPGIAELKRMFVVPQARGRGVARRMLGALEAQAGQLGYATLRLGTGVGQPEAMALYESCGYRRVPLFGEYLTAGDLCVCYERALSS